MNAGTVPTIDIYKHAQRYERELRKLEEDVRLPERSRELILRFLTDARTGRTVKHGAKKRLSPGRCRKLLYVLKRFAVLVQKPLDRVAVPDMERVVLGMEDGRITKAGPGSSPYSDETIKDFKKIIRKFYRWHLATDPKRFEDLTGWFDTQEIQNEVRTFTLEDARRMADAIGGPQGRALVMLLFDGGLRISELFNVRLGDVTFEPDSEGVLTCFVRVRVSKTKPRTVSLPLATKEVRFWVERHPGGGPIGHDGAFAPKDPQEQLVVWSPAYCKKKIRIVGNAELGQRLYFHRFRHSSATHYAKLGLSEYQMCARYGWSIGSNVPRRYVELSQINAAETAAVARKAEESVRERGTQADPRVDLLIERLKDRPDLIDALRSALG